MWAKQLGLHRRIYKVRNRRRQIIHQRQSRGFEHAVIGPAMRVPPNFGIVRRKVFVKRLRGLDQVFGHGVLSHG